MMIRIDAAPHDKWGLGLIFSTGSNAHLRISKQLATGCTHWRCLAYRLSNRNFAKAPMKFSSQGRAECPHWSHRVIFAESFTPTRLRAMDPTPLKKWRRARGRKGTSISGSPTISQSLKVAPGVSEENLWKQIRAIDLLNEKGSGIRILKSSEVDILADGSLDYPDALLKELDYTVCSIHSSSG